MNDKMHQLITYYTVYVSAALDLLTQLQDAFNAADIQNLIKEIVTDIARKAYLLGQEDHQ